ncbi:hypothetical protein AADZ86_00630 [Colwelliaceae bacterium BS250]
MNFRFIIILLMSLLVTTSSFSLVQYLTAQLQQTLEPQNIHNHTNIDHVKLNYGLYLGLPIAQVISLQFSEYGSNNWLKLAQIVARDNAAIAWQLVTYYRNKNLSRDSQYWFSQATKLGSSDALIEQALQLASVDEYRKAQHLLAPLINKNQQALLLSSKLAVEFNDMALLSVQLPLLTTPQGKNLSRQIARYRVFANSAPDTNTMIEQIQSCQYPIQFFASSIAQLTAIEDKLQRIADKPFFNEQFCLLTPRFIAKQQLQCSHAETDRINCDDSFWADVEIEKQVKYIGVVGQAGGANVNHGIVYIDPFDTQQVLEHELLHLIGFIDEYPLHRSNSACLHTDTQAIGKNVLLAKQTIFPSEQAARQQLLEQLPWARQIKATTPLTHSSANNKHVILGTPKEYSDEVGLFAAETCNKQQQSTFKPVSQSTQLQYFEEPLPEQYKYDQYIPLTASVPKQSIVLTAFNMPSYHYNLGLYYQNKQQQTIADEWFARAALQETSEQRKAIISKGEF